MKHSAVQYYCIALIILIIGIPGFLRFDTSGWMTDEIGLLNAQSLSRVILYSLVTYVVALVFLLSAKKSPVSKDVTSAVAPFVVLYVYYLLNTVFFLSGTDLLLAAYRLLEWAVVIALIVLIYSGKSASPRDVFFKVIKAAIFIPIIITVVFTPLSPDLAYHYSGFGQYFRLGSYLYSSNVLGVLAGIGVTLSLMHYSGVKRILGVGGFALVLVLTHTRGAMAGLFVAAVSTPFLFHHKKLLSFLSITLVIAVITFFVGQVVDYFSRGQGIEGLMQVGGRIDAWDATLQTFAQSPWFGTGYIVGPKKIGEVSWGAGILHWYPRSAHNDILQGLVSGGLPAALLSCYIYAKIFLNIYYVASRDLIDRRRASFYWMLGVQLLAFGLLTPMINAHPFVLPILFVWLYVEVDLIVRADRPRSVALQNPNPGSFAGASARWSEDGRGP